MNKSDQLPKQDLAQEAVELFPDYLYQETFTERAKTNSAIARVLLGSEFGQTIINKGFLKHPAKQERARQYIQLQKLAFSYEKSGIFPKETDLQEIALSEPDMRPLSVPSLASVERLLQKKRIANLQTSLSTKQYASLTHFDFKLDPPDENDPFSGEDLVGQYNGKVREQILDIYNDQIYCAIRDRVLNLAGNGYWRELVDLFSQLHPIPELKSQLSKLFKSLGSAIFHMPAFREQLVFLLIRQVAILNFDGHQSLTEFFVEAGFPTISEQEKTKFITPKIINDTLDTAWRYNQDKYFEVVHKLYEYGLIDEKFLQSDPTFRLHVIEFSLRALRRNEQFLTFIKLVKPFVLSAGVFAENELSLLNQRELFADYQQLCQQLKITLQPDISRLFRRENHAQKWEE